MRRTTTLLTHGEDFQYHGQVYIEIMGRQDEEWVEYKNNEMQLKLKKKQDHQIHEENRHLGKSVSGGKKKLHIRPLGDSSRINTTKSTQGRDVVDKKPLHRANTGSAKSRTYAS